jgi:hypothetical protein
MLRRLQRLQRRCRGAVSLRRPHHYGVAREAPWQAAVSRCDPRQQAAFLLGAERPLLDLPTVNTSVPSPAAPNGSVMPLAWAIYIDQHERFVKYFITRVSLLLAERRGSTFARDNRLLPCQPLHRALEGATFIVPGHNKFRNPACSWLTPPFDLLSPHHASQSSRRHPGAGLQRSRFMSRCPHPHVALLIRRQDHRHRLGIPKASFARTLATY